MTRKEEIQNAAYSQYCNSSSVIFTALFEAYKLGAEWADAHPLVENVFPEQAKKALVDKACNWLKDNLPNWVDSYKEDIIIKTFRKAMEE